MKTNHKGSIALWVIFLLLFSLAGCQNNPQKPAPEESKNKTPELPEIFTEMEQRILEMLYVVDGIAGIEKSIEEKEKVELEVEMETEIDLTMEEKDTASKKKVDPNMYIAEESILIPLLKEEEIESEIIKLEEPPDDIQEVWYQLEENLYQLHRQWNVVEAHLQQVNVPEALLRETESKMNQATLKLKARQKMEGMLELNGIMSDLSKYRSYFRHRVPSELYKLSYHIRQAAILTAMEEYEESKLEVEEAKEVAEGLRSKLLEKDASDVVHKLMLSIDDLEQEVTNQEPDLVLLKATIVMKNINMAISPFESTTDSSQ